MATLNGPNDSDEHNGWFVDTNFWDTDALGAGYKLNGTYNPNNLTTGLKYTWNFGPLPADGYYWVHAFPEVGYGQDAWSKTILSSERPYPLAIADLSKYQVSYDVDFGGQTDGYNVALEMYLTSSPGGGPNTMTNEVMVWVHNGGWPLPGPPVGTFSDKDYSGKIYSYGVYESGLHFNYTAVLTNADNPSGTIDLKALMQRLKSLGVIKGNEYITNIQLGAEVAAGSGWLAVNKMQLDIQSAGSSEVLIDGTGSTTVSGSSSGSGSGSGSGPGPSTPPSSRGMAAGPLAADFNNDGRSDIIWANRSGQAIIWTMNGGAKLAASATIGTSDASVRVVAAADFNGDGKSDLLLQKSNGQPIIWTMNGLSRVSAQTAGTNPGSSWKIVTSGDFDGDARADIVWQDAQTGAAKIWLMNGSSVKSSATIGNPGANWNVVGSGDLNGNGKADIIWQNTQTGQIQLWTMNGVSVTSKTNLAANPGADWDVVGTGDFNDDGKSDLLMQNSGGGVQIWEMNGGATLSGGVLKFNSGAGWKAIGARDYNGDGKDDILFRNTSGQAMVWAMNGLTRLSSATVAGPGSSWSAIT